MPKTKKPTKTNKIDEDVLSERLDAKGLPAKATIQLRQDKKTKENLIMLQESHKTKTGKQSFSSVFFMPIKSAIRFIKKLFWWSRKYDIDLSELDELNKESTEKISKELTETKLRLAEAEQNIATYKVALSQREEEFRKKREIDISSELPRFKLEIAEFEKLIAKFEEDKKTEEELQKFFESHPWFLNLYYKDFKPQKLSGMTSRFDFYLKRFDDSEEVIELKRVDVNFLNKDGTITSDFAQAIDQMLGYFDEVLDISFSPRLSKKFDIREFYPRGILVFGFRPNQETRDFIRRWRNATRIEIFTYDDILEGFKTTVKNLEAVKQ
jgi:hypothetical protein